ncbi:MAG: HigA family addiction module antitoxin [Candidatus Pararuminococcus gallinarum]|jgi:HTH-type transcriptional regulator/antitoxin HigA
MGEKITGLSRDLIFHPGETLREILDDRGMSQKELSQRTGVRESYISNIINGKKNISATFAKKMEYALGIESSFWINLQANYEKEVLDLKEQNEITDDELQIAEKLNDILKYLEDRNFIENTPSSITKLLELRKFLSVCNLTLIPSLQYNNIAFRTSETENIDIYVLYAWQKLCEKLTCDVETNSELNLSKLNKNILMIKELMFLKDPNDIQNKLTKIFSDCGIAFAIVPNFRGAPVQGYIKKISENRLMLCMTLRRSYADIFWFTLFHEIAHILNEDYQNYFVDFQVTRSEVEDKADKFAKDTLIDPIQYQHFLSMKRHDLQSIEMFARMVSVPPYIVIGRMQKEKIIGFNMFSNEKPRYKWGKE